MCAQSHEVIRRSVTSWGKPLHGHGAAAPSRCATGGHHEASDWNVGVSVGVRRGLRRVYGQLASVRTRLDGERWYGHRNGSGHDVDAGGSPVPIVLTGVHGRRAVAGGFEFAGKVFGTAAHGLGVVQDDLHFCVFFE